MAQEHAKVELPFLYTLHITHVILIQSKRRERGYWGANSSPGCVFMFPLVRSFKSANESTILYPGLEFAPH